MPRVHPWARGVDAARFTPRRRCADLRATLAPDGEVLVGYVGRLAPEKHVHRLAALAGLPGIRLVVVGAGTQRDAPAHRAARRGLPRLPRRRRARPPLRLARRLRLTPDPTETFCQAVQEALASGLPVVAPDTGGPRDLVLPGRTGHLVGDDTALRDAVEHLLDPAVRARFGATARRSVLRRTWSTVGDELVAHYTAVLTDSEQRAA